MELWTLVARPAYVQVCFSCRRTDTQPAAPLHLSRVLHSFTMLAREASILLH